MGQQNHSKSRPQLFGFDKVMWLIVILLTLVHGYPLVSNGPHLSTPNAINETSDVPVQTISSVEPDHKVTHSYSEGTEVENVTDVETITIAPNASETSAPIFDSNVVNTTAAVIDTVGNFTEYNETAASDECFVQATEAPTFNTGIIIGISILVVVVLVLAGVVGFILYRHTLWNRPQTLSDKCSNDESTGYIDDTFRENSEELYSLDNDSFLNSLEAMTIQNYWTDHVKHTKL